MRVNAQLVLALANEWQYQNEGWCELVSIPNEIQPPRGRVLLLQWLTTARSSPFRTPMKDSAMSLRPQDDLLSHQHLGLRISDNRPTKETGSSSFLLSVAVATVKCACVLHMRRKH